MYFRVQTIYCPLVYTYAVHKTNRTTNMALAADFSSGATVH
jgi:hypothetical protein